MEGRKKRRKGRLKNMFKAKVLKIIEVDKIDKKEVRCQIESREKVNKRRE